MLISFQIKGLRFSSSERFFELYVNDKLKNSLGSDMRLEDLSEAELEVLKKQYMSKFPKHCKSLDAYDRAYKLSALKGHLQKLSKKVRKKASNKGGAVKNVTDSIAEVVRSSSQIKDQD